MQWKMSHFYSSSTSAEHQNHKLSRMYLQHLREEFAAGLDDSASVGKGQLGLLHRACCDSQLCVAVVHDSNDDVTKWDGQRSVCSCKG